MALKSLNNFNIQIQMDVPQTIKERLKLFISHLGISEREFCRNVGVGSAYIASIKKSIKADKLDAITKRYPELNPIWLMRGTGEMYSGAAPLPRTLPEPEPVSLPSEMLNELLDEARKEKARLLSIIESQQRTIEQLTAMASKKEGANVRPVAPVCNVDAG